MGNYYEVANFDKRERFGADNIPQSWDIKWGTFANGGPQMRVLAYLLCNGASNRHANLPTVMSRWFGDRVGIVGDFSDISDEIEEYTDITPLIVKEFCESPGGRALVGLEDFRLPSQTQPTGNDQATGPVSEDHESPNKK